MSAYSLNWHRDYAAESILRRELSQWCEHPDYEWACEAVYCRAVVSLILQSEREFTSPFVRDIAQTVIDIIAEQCRAGRSYRKVTKKQVAILVPALLEVYGSARAIAGAVWGLTDEEIDNADV